MFECVSVCCACRGGGGGGAEPEQRQHASAACLQRWMWRWMLSDRYIQRWYEKYWSCIKENPLYLIQTASSVSGLTVFTHTRATPTLTCVLRMLLCRSCEDAFEERARDVAQRFQKGHSDNMKNHHFIGCSVLLQNNSAGSRMNLCFHEVR